jgi:hypothetical protein
MFTADVNKHSFPDFPLALYAAIAETGDNP